MKIAFTSTGTTWDSMIDPRFGRTENILLFDEESDVLKVVTNGEVKDEAHGAGTATAQKLFSLDPDVLITGNGPGETAAKALKNLRMKIYVGAQDVSVLQAYDRYKSGMLQEL